MKFVLDIKLIKSYGVELVSIAIILVNKARRAGFLPGFEKQSNDALKSSIWIQ